MLGDTDTDSEKLILGEILTDSDNETLGEIDTDSDKLMLGDILTLSDNEKLGETL